MLRRLAVGLLIVLAVTAVASLPAGVAASDASGGADGAMQTTPEGFSSTVFEITVYENGSARWTLRHVRVLENESEVETFRAFATRFEENESDLLADFRTRARRLTAAGSEQTGREMTASNFQRRAFVRDRDENGVVEVSFLWTNFAETPGERVVVGDVFEGGMYILDDQRLVFRAGPDLGFASADPDPDATSEPGNLTASESATWIGEREFLDNRPQVEFVTAGSGSASNEGTVGGQDQNGNGGESLTIMMGVLVLLLAVGGGIAWYSGRFPGSGDGEAIPEGTATDSTGTAHPDTADASATDQPEPVIGEEELVSDEDRVIRMLEENGGRMKQVNIVEETEWSKSKVSMLLSEMEDEGEISKLRVGRENIISLSGEEPDAVGSPFDDDS